MFVAVCWGCDQFTRDVVTTGVVASTNRPMHAACIVVADKCMQKVAMTSVESCGTIGVWTSGSIDGWIRHDGSDEPMGTLLDQTEN